MKYFLVAVATLVSGVLWAQSKGGNDTATANPNFDKALAQKLGSNDYGMKSYFLVILKTGKNTTTDKDLIEKASGDIWTTSTVWLMKAN